MRSTSLLALLTLWTSTTSAFYPFQPEWHKQLQQKQESRRNVVRQEAKGVTLGLKQRSDSATLSTSDRAARDVKRLWEKYGPREPSEPDSSNTVVKRGNDYSVMTAADPGKPKTAGLDQDGTDYSYFVQVQFGSADQELYMLVDTGAGSTWVMGSSCSSDACTKHDLFSSDDSTTFDSDGDDDFSIAYGSGSVNGTLVTDAVSVAGMSLNYEFGLATTTSDDFSTFAFDGANDNFLQSIEKAKELDKNLFAIALNRAADGTDTGEISFGTIDDDKYTGDITYTPTGTDDDWAIQIDSMAYGGTEADVGGILSYIDTGTSFIFGPQDLVQKLHAVIPGASSSDSVTYTVPCDSDKALTFTFSGVDFAVSSKDWISPPSSSGTCTSNIYGQEVVKGSWLLGDTFIKNVYAVFDMDQKRIGFATMAAVTEESTTSTSSSSPSSTTAAGNSTMTTASHATTTALTAKPMLGLGTHETSASTGTAAAETSKPTSHKKHNSAPGGQVQNANYAFVACTLSFLALLAW